MSDAARDGAPDVETEPDPTPARTADMKVFVDARCVVCKWIRVHNLPATASAWKRADERRPGTCTFHTACDACGEQTPHNILSFLSGLNRSREDAISISTVRDD